VSLARGRRLVIPLTVLSICIAVAACRSSPASKAVPAPPGLPPFYAVPAGVAQKSPGTVLKSQSLPDPRVHGSTIRVMYVSTDAKGRSVPVTGLVFVPVSPPPPGGYPVVSWAHGTNGMADQCAPSLKPDTVLSTGVLNSMLALGWAVAATDYQGEGTPPGLLPFLVGDVAAHNTIDIVLAARKLPLARVGRDYIVLGHSEGGQSALFAWKLAPTYGSRSGVHMAGVVAAAPPSQLSTLWQQLSPTPNRVYLYMILAGFNAAYGNRAAPLDAVLAPGGTALLPTLQQECLGSVTAEVNAYPFTELVKANPFGIAAWRRLLTQNDPARFRSANKVPLLIVHGGADELIPVATSAALADQLCSKGANLERWVYPGQNHGGVVFVSAVDMGRWMIERFAARSSPVHYQPTGETGVQVRTCR
jgi:pimeloyl-ACP methyl ester carboxylesterase